MRLATVAGPDGTTFAAARTGDSFERLVNGRGEPYADVGELLRDGLAAARGEPVEVDGGHRLLRPVLHPAAVVCVGANYGAHVREMGRETPTAPTLFAKLPQALTDPEAAVVLPPESSAVDYEGELVAVIGRGGRRIAREEALGHVAGVTLMNDVSVRDFQYRSLQWFAGKSWQGLTPVGPEVVTLDEVGDLRRLELVTTVNGEVRQQGSVGDLIFDLPTLVADVSQIVELAPGDLIATGTPGGVGHAMDPPRFLRPGDVVEVTVAGIGTLRNAFSASR